MSKSVILPPPEKVHGNPDIERAIEEALSMAQEQVAAPPGTDPDVHLRAMDHFLRELGHVLSFRGIPFKSAPVMAMQYDLPVSALSVSMSDGHVYKITCTSLGIFSVRDEAAELITTTKTDIVALLLTGIRCRCKHRQASGI